MLITFVQTGGTIDKGYPAGEQDHGYEFLIGDPAYEPILARVQPNFEYEQVSVLKKDSLDITANDRTRIYEKIVGLKNDKIVITHGTDTIRLTAERLSDIEDKVIVLTGAMLPEKFYDSDAEFNLGMAVAGVQTLPPGVYIALYGRIVPWQKFDNTPPQY